MYTTIMKDFNRGSWKGEQVFLIHIVTRKNDQENITRKFFIFFINLM